ncbi:MAG: tetratricopeptide repeat protein [Calditrichaeota bacterium]|nr:MAG: tetratricopeptide repeat protein [Calditrichota bacterium]
MRWAFRKWPGMVMIMLFVLVQGVHPAEQIKNREALRWFNKGTRESNLDKKIEYYRKAIALEPKFVEALYNLGLTYKKKKDYENAEKYLLRAYTAKPDKISKEIKLSILYDLSFIYKKLGRLKDSEEAVRGAVALMPKKSMQAKLYLELGRLLYQQGRYDEALVELEKGKDLLPEYRGQFSQMIELSENMQTLNQLYEDANRAQKAGDLKRARSLYEKIYTRNKTFRNVDRKLTELDSMISRQNAESLMAAAVRQAEQYEAEGKLELALAIYENLQQSHPSPEIQKKLTALQEKYRQWKLNQDLLIEYENGVSALKLKNWAAAVYSFEKIMAANPGFKDARRKLDIAKRGMENAKVETLLSQYYENGLAAMKEKDYEKAQAAFEKISQVNANYRDVQALLQQVQEARAEAAESEKPALQTREATLDSLYQVALYLMEQKSWSEANVVLEKIRILDPGYKDIVDLLATTRTNMASASKTTPSLKAGNTLASRLLFWGGLGFTLVSVPLIGMFIFLPAVRARFYLLRGNYVAAAQIYEKLLERNPGRLKPYPVLADLYLLLGRRDDQALNIFKVIVRLKLTTKRQEQIEEILTQNYLKEGNTDDDAISLLEAALKSETRKLQAGHANPTAETPGE